MSPDQQAEQERFRAVLTAIEKREQAQRIRRHLKWKLAGWLALFAAILWLAWKNFS